MRSLGFGRYIPHHRTKLTQIHFVSRKLPNLSRGVMRKATRRASP